MNREAIVTEAVYLHITTRMTVAQQAALQARDPRAWADWCAASARLFDACTADTITPGVVDLLTPPEPPEPVRRSVEAARARRATKAAALKLLRRHSWVFGYVLGLVAIASVFWR